MTRKQAFVLHKNPYQVPAMLMSFLISLTVSFTYKRKALLAVFVYLFVYIILYFVASLQCNAPLATQTEKAASSTTGLQTVFSLYLQCVLPLFILYVANLDTSALHVNRIVSTLRKSQIALLSITIMSITACLLPPQGSLLPSFVFARKT